MNKSKDAQKMRYQSKYKILVTSYQIIKFNIKMPHPINVTAFADTFWHLRRFGSVVMEPHNSFTSTTNLLKSCPPCVNIN